ncbi:MAG: ribonuclease P protein component [Myxococcota bacterium]
MAADEAAGRRVRRPAGALRAPISQSGDRDRSDAPPARGVRGTGAPWSERGSQRFRPTDRLLDRRDFDRVLRKGRRRSSAELVVVTCRCPDGPTGGRGKDAAEASAGLERREGLARLGITVSRKAGGAVDRNRFKRRIREWFRRHREDFENGLDVVVIARRPGVELGYGALGDCLSQLLPRRAPRHG